MNKYQFTDFMNNISTIANYMHEARFDFDNDLLFIEGTYHFFKDFDIEIGFYEDYSIINVCMAYDFHYVEAKLNIARLKDLPLLLRELAWELYDETLDF